jgi:hypothetical protein
VSTKVEERIVPGGGPYNGVSQHMTSYWSALGGGGGVCAGMTVIGTMAISGVINIIHVRFVCDNEEEVKHCNQKQTKSVFHNTEGDWDLARTYRGLKKQW